MALDKDLEGGPRSDVHDHNPLHGFTSPNPGYREEAIDVEKSEAEEPQEDILRTNTKTNPIRRIISTRSAASYDPGPPPDGGLAAWTQALMAHFVIFTTWGYINSFGVFQTYYTTALRHPPSDISWVGSVQIFLIFSIGTVSGRALDAGIFKPVFILGICFQLVASLSTSFCKEYWQLFLAQGICMGIGNGLQFCPTVAIISHYFTNHRNVAIGIAAAGSASGGMVFPAIVKVMLAKYGLGWTVRTIGFVNLALGIMTATLLKPRLPPRKSGPLVEWSAFKEAPYRLYLLGMFLNFWGLYFGFYYIISYARDKIGLTYTDSISLLLTMNGVGLLARVIPNFLADKYTGPINQMIFFAFGTGIMLYGWAGVHSVSGAWVFAIFYGVFAAGVQGLFPAGLSSLTADPKKAGTRMGMGFTVVGIACLTGPPLAGGLIQLNPNGDYLYAQMWAGSSVMCGTVVVAASRIAKTGWVFRARA